MCHYRPNRNDEPWHNCCPTTYLCANWMTRRPGVAALASGEAAKSLTSLAGARSEAGWLTTPNGRQEMTTS
ncbi:hypothetical protein MSEN_31590 [Mycolicibacter senuensis]|uniref:Uncharacterized protein n=1 Tax=Mycolicibacter senuensis TaxID=386913 RepID=A0A7I9XND2_9MYCO|nr:hypothetical protein MSEN_31590 [Mycolicibacter senuensis]